MTITQRIFDDHFLTGGLPVVPDNATRAGLVDPSTLTPGTVVNVMTKSMSKWVLTIQEDGTASIEQNVWFNGQHYSSQDILKELRRLDELAESLKDKFPMIGLETSIRVNGEEYSSSRHDRGMMPIYTVTKARVVSFSAEGALHVKTFSGQVKISGTILFWWID